MSFHINAAQGVAFHRALGAREAANELQGRSDEPSGDVIKQLMKQHADGFNALITDAITDAASLSPRSLQAEVQKRMQNRATPLGSPAQRATRKAEITAQIREEGPDAKEYAEEAVQVHTGALNQLDALVENDGSRLRRAGSLNRIVRRMKDGTASNAEYAFFHDPNDAAREFPDRTPFELGYGLMQKYPQLQPPVNAAVAHAHAAHAVSERVTGMLDTIGSLSARERPARIRELLQNPNEQFSAPERERLSTALRDAEEEILPAVHLNRSHSGGAMRRESPRNSVGPYSMRLRSSISSDSPSPLAEAPLSLPENSPPALMQSVDAARRRGTGSGPLNLLGQFDNAAISSPVNAANNASANFQLERDVMGNIILRAAGTERIFTSHELQRAHLIGTQRLGDNGLHAVVEDLRPHVQSVHRQDNGIITVQMHHGEWLYLTPAQFNERFVQPGFGSYSDF